MTYREWLHEFSLRLSELIYENKITQDQLCQMTGLGKSTISRYLHERQMPNLRAILNLSYAFHMSVDDLIDFGEKIDSDQSGLPEWMEYIHGVDE